MVTGIIVTHGNLCRELIETAKVIFGNFSDCYAVSNSSKSSQALFEDLEEIVSRNENSDYVMFVDFFGGSCSYACLKFQREHRDIPIISGINLPIFLAFLNKRDEVAFENLPDELILRGKDSIKIVKL